MLRVGVRLPEAACQQIGLAQQDDHSHQMQWRRVASTVGCVMARGGRPPFFSDASSRRLCLLYLTETLAKRFRITRQDLRHVLDPAMLAWPPQQPAYRQPPEEALHLLFDLSLLPTRLCRPPCSRNGSVVSILWLQQSGTFCVAISSGAWRI